MTTPFLAAGGFTWFGSLAHVPAEYLHIVHASVVFFIILLLSLVYRASLKPLEEEIIPSPHVSFKNLVQAGLEKLFGLFDSIIPHDAAQYASFLAAIFVFIFISNLFGLVPGFLPPTGNISMNLGIGLAVLIYFNAAGIKKQGFKKHFGHLMGPLLPLAILIFPLEAFGTFVVRPLSLSLRLFGNIEGDHMVLSTIANLVPVGVPILFMAFGIFVAFMQSFVFTLLSTVYVGLAVESHDDHH